jgi:four helix bundle protein
MRGPKFASLKRQLYRAAESIPANIVESRSHHSSKEAARFLRIALNSATELEYHLLAARDLRAISTRDYEGMTESVIEVRKML